MQHGCSPIASRFLFSGPESPIKKNTHWLVMYHFLATSKAILLFLKKSLFRSHFSPAICNSIPCALPGPNVCLQLGGSRESEIGDRGGDGAAPTLASGSRSSTSVRLRPRSPGPRSPTRPRLPSRGEKVMCVGPSVRSRRPPRGADKTTRQGEQAPR